MEILPLKTTHIIKKNEDLLEVLYETFKANHVTLQEKDVLVVTEKVAALCQGRIVNLNEITTVTERAKKLGQEYSEDPRLVELILHESSHIFGGVPGMLLTVNSGIFVGNAGIDHSNAGKADDWILWPSKPYDLCSEIEKQIKLHYKLSQFGVMISDSRVQPLKRGVVGVAIGVSGFYPIDDCRGRKDLFSYKMHFTVRAVADQLCDAAHAVMGECDEQTPFVLIRNAPVVFTEEKIDPNQMLMPIDEDLFIQILKKYDKNKIQ